MLSPLDEALSKVSRADPKFTEGIRTRLAPVKDRFFSKSPNSDKTKTPPALPLYLTEPDLRKVAIELAEFALEHGLSVNVAVDHEGNTLLHEFTRLKDYPAIAAEAVEWLLAHGADPYLPRKDGQTPLDLAVESGFTAVTDSMRASRGEA